MGADNKLKCAFRWSVVLTGNAMFLYYFYMNTHTSLGVPLALLVTFWLGFVIPTVISCMAGPQKRQREALALQGQNG